MCFKKLITQYYTDYTYAPVKRIARASKTGHGTNIIAGMSVGMESTGMPVIVIAISLFTSYTLGSTSGLPSHMGVLFFLSFVFVCVCVCVCVCFCFLSDEN